jgi:hypothetical protein
MESIFSFVQRLTHLTGCSGDNGVLGLAVNCGWPSLFIHLFFQQDLLDTVCVLLRTGHRICRDGHVLV